VKPTNKLQRSACFDLHQLRERTRISKTTRHLRDAARQPRLAQTVADGMTPRSGVGNGGLTARWPAERSFEPQKTVE
jgi:hypothetical protein